VGEIREGFPEAVTFEMDFDGGLENPSGRKKIMCVQNAEMAPPWWYMASS
jgi:hypothetical protein